MTSVFPVKMLGVLRMAVDIPLFSVWARGRKELLGGREADCLAIQGRRETEMLFTPTFPCWFPFSFYLTEVPLLQEAFLDTHFLSFHFLLDS